MGDVKKSFCAKNKQKYLWVGGGGGGGGGGGRVSIIYSETHHWVEAVGQGDL